MIRERVVSTVAAVLFCLYCLAGIASAASPPLFDIQFIMIAANDAKATIKKADGSLQIIQPGDVIADTFTVRMIAPGRIMLENSATDGPKAVIVRLEYGRQWIEALGGGMPPGAPPSPASPALPR